MADGYLLGLDKGTSVVKAVLFRPDGTEVSAASRPAPSLYPQPGWHEERLSETWAATCAVVREAMAGIRPEEIRGMGITSHMSGLILLDRAGNPLGNAVLWSDSRAGPVVKAWEEQGLLERMFPISGQAVLPGLTLPLLRWFADHRPEVLEQAAHALTMKDWLRYRMVGEVATEESDVAWMMGDVAKRAFSDDLLALAGLEQYRRLYPPIQPYGDMAGGLLAGPAAELGLRPGTPVVYGLGDATASTLGVGATRAGQACSIIGTSFLNNLITREIPWEPANIGFVFPMTDGQWLRLLPNTGGGSVNLRWFVQMFYPGLDGAAAYAKLDEEASASPVGANGVIYHPYINTAGVVAPFYSIGARAQFFGLSVQTTRADMARAVLEGVALSMRDCYAAANESVREIRLSGGAAQSPVLCQICADCTGATIRVPAGTESAAAGVAMLAAVATGMYRSLTEAADHMVRVNRSYSPNPERSARYDEVYGLFREIRTQLIRPWDLRTQIYQS